MEPKGTVVDRIRALANAHGDSLTTLEVKLGFGNGTISRWNQSSAGSDKLTKIADHFNVSIDYLLGREQKEMPTGIGERSMSDEELKFALWGDCQDIDEADLEDVRRYAAFVRERKHKK